MPTAQQTQETTQQGQDMIAQMIDNPIFARVIKAIFGIGIVFLGFIVAKIIAHKVRRKILNFAHHKDEEGEQQMLQIASLVKDVVFYTVIVFAVFIAFEVVGFDIGLLLGGISFGVGMAFREVLGNMISGILLLTMKEVSLGDTIRIDVGSQEYFGKVEEISIRTTSLRLFNNKLVVLPNMKIIESAIKTHSAEEMIRLETVVEVDYATSTEFAVKVLTQAINSCDFVKNPSKTTVLTHELGASGIAMKCFFYVDPNGGWTMEQLTGHINHVIVEYCRANKIEIPYPHLDVEVKGMKRVERG